MFYAAKHAVLSKMFAFILNSSYMEEILDFEQCGYLSIRIFEHLAPVQTFNF